jgi:hypothetical protein
MASLIIICGLCLWIHKCQTLLAIADIFIWSFCFGLDGTYGR